MHRFAIEKTLSKYLMCVFVWYNFGGWLGGVGLGIELKLCIWYRGILSVGYLPSPEQFSSRFLKVFLASELAQLTGLFWLLLTQLWTVVVKVESWTLASFPAKHRLAMTPEGKGHRVQ